MPLAWAYYNCRRTVTWNARSVGYYHEFFDACERRDPLEAERVIHESIRGAVDLIWPTLPSELEDAQG